VQQVPELVDDRAALPVDAAYHRIGGATGIFAWNTGDDRLPGSYKHLFPKRKLKTL